ncbi:hypothetical protein [Acinetobacter venetianus]|uniref:hypothetical protein n=1 Tax=Acinetobacter venetianus TaxID=52133 RepID=UPI003A912FC9
MAKAKRNKKRVIRKPEQLMNLSNGFSGINKIVFDQIDKKRKELRSEIEHTYEMSKAFIPLDIRNYVENGVTLEKELIGQYPRAKTLPYHITIGAYEFQDLAIALNLSHIDVLVWNVESTIYLEKEDEYEHVTASVPFNRTLPAMTHVEFLGGKRDCKIELGHGLKKVGWAGFNEEVLKELKSHKQFDDDFGIDHIEAVIRADVKFINTAAYEEFLRVQDWVNQGREVAEHELRALWIREQEATLKAFSHGLEDVA